jgi:ferrochelatase
VEADRVVVVALAQHSAHVYIRAVRDALGNGVEVVGPGNWGQTPALLDAFAARIRGVARTMTDEEREAATLLFTAHSLPKFVIEGGDPYEAEVRASAEAVATRVADIFPRWQSAYQSQGMSPGRGGRPLEWLGPDLRSALDAIAQSGSHGVVFAPIGFLADHVEILYDLDIEARGLVEARGMSYRRAASLDDADDFVEVLAALVRPHLP